MKKRMLNVIPVIALMLSVSAFNIFASGDTETEIIVVPGAELFTGDCDGNGIIDTADATAILKYIIHESDIEESAADCDGNGIIDTADATAILKYIIHEYTFPE